MAKGRSASGVWNDPGSTVRRFALHLVREKHGELDLRLRRVGCAFIFHKTKSNSPMKTTNVFLE
jgi:hypothetical protein